MVISELPPGAQDLDRKLAAGLERLGQAVRVQLWDHAKAHGLTPTQLQVLLRLAYPPHQQRVGALAAELDLTQPTISDAVAALQRKGLITREQTGKNPRLAVVSLSPRGTDIATSLEGWDTRTRDVLTALPESQKAEGLRLILELIAGLQRAGVITIARMCVTCRFFQEDAHGPRYHHCALLNLPLAPTDLRVDCPEHQRAA